MPALVLAEGNYMILGLLQTSSMMFYDVFPIMSQGTPSWELCMLKKEFGDKVKPSVSLSLFQQKKFEKITFQMEKIKFVNGFKHLDLKMRRSNQ